MGTRNITQVILNDKTVVSQYCQWDGYPDGQGATVLQFLKEMERSVFELKLGKLINPTTEENQVMWHDIARRVAEAKEDATKESVAAAVETIKETGMCGIDVSDLFKEEHPTLQRDMGAEILQHIHDSTEPVEVVLDLEFMNDSLFCEWVYVIDLDNNKLEVYGGMNHSAVPASNRFQLPDGETPTPSYEGADTYYPVTLICEFPLDDLPTEEAFINICEGKEADPEALAKAALNELRDTLIVDSDNSELLTTMVNYLEANLDDFLETTE